MTFPKSNSTLTTRLHNENKIGSDEASNGDDDVAIAATTTTTIRNLMPKSMIFSKNKW